MLHAAPTSETKADTAPGKSRVAPQPEQELHPLVQNRMGQYPFSGMSRATSGFPPGVQRSQVMAGMQSAYGNQAVLRTLHASPQAARIAPLRPSQSVMVQRACACGGSPESEGECEECKAKREAGISPKLTINQPGDMFEQEADAVAERVMTMPEAQVPRQAGGEKGVSTSTADQIQPLIQRQDDLEQSDQQNAPEATGDLSDEELEDLEASNVAPSLQRKQIPSPNGKAEGEHQSLHNAIARQNAGNTLDHTARSFMESRFGHDFSQVRIHTDEQANKAARSIDARAFTVGQNIWFAHGEFSPGSHAGRHLLAHELTHTIQQRGKSSPAIHRSYCPDHCKAPISAGKHCTASKVVRDNCEKRDAKDTNNMITHIRVLISSRKVELYWNGEPGTCKGKKTEIDCTPNPAKTLRVKNHKVGRKCGINHTSYKKYNMAYFTEFSDDMRFGFHDSQPLGAKFVSAGCVRVSCEDAQIINENTSSGTTTVTVQNTDTGDCPTGDSGIISPGTGGTKESPKPPDGGTKEGPGPVS